MDFDSLARRDLQFFCKKNKIPANMTNIAMADALKALEIVEGIDEFVNQSESTRDQSPTSVAKNLPSAARTAARTTRRKTKDETQTSELVTRSCNVTSKSLAGELEQENRNTNVLQNPSVPQGRGRAAVTSIAMNLEVTDVSKTPAARSTRRAQTAASSVQRVYSTRRSVKLLEESMADLSLKTKESLNVPAKQHDDAESEDLPAGSQFQAKSDDNSGKTEEAEVISVRDLNDSLEKEWNGSKNDPDIDILYGDLGDITFSDATSKEQMNGTESNTVPASDGFVQVEEQDPSEDDGSGGVVDTKASGPIVDESEELESDNDSEESCESVELMDNDSEESSESDELMDNESEVALVSDKKKTQASSVPTVLIADEPDSDAWSDYEIEVSETEENSCDSEELIDSELEEAPVSDKKTPASSSTLAGKETKSPLKTPFEAESISDPNKSALKLDFVADNKNKGNVRETVLINNGERKVEAEDKKKKTAIDEESLKDVSMRQLTKMVKEFTIKSKQQHKSVE